MRPLLLVCLALPAVAQPPPLADADRVRLAEAFRLADAVADGLWPGWSQVPFATLLVTPGHEFLVRHPRPSDDFALVSAYDPLLRSAVYARDRQFPPDLLATFPAVGGIPTVVVGTPERTGLSSTLWVLTLLHEHFHQFQMGQPGYYDAVAALDLAGDDTSGMWMLTYPFPYESDAVTDRFDAYRDALARGLGALGPDAEAALADVLAARARLRGVLSDADDRYLAFQLWQEGVARYTQIRVAEAAARAEPLAAFRALPDAVPYAAAVDSLRRGLTRELEHLDLANGGRPALYPVGAAEALLLDAARPGWRERYLAEPSVLERYAEGP